MTSANWPRVRLGDHCDAERGISWTRDKEAAQGTPALTIPNIQESLDLSKITYLQGLSSKETTRAQIRAGHTIMVGSNGNKNRVGDCIFFADDSPFVYASFLMGIRPRHDSVLNAQFLHYWLKSPEFRDPVQASLVGATSLGNLRISAVRDAMIPAPSLQIQRKIAHILSAYDELIQINMQRASILAEMGRLLYREWFVEFRFRETEGHPIVASSLRSIPHGWESKLLSDVVEDIVDYRGKTPTKLNGEWVNEGIIALSALNVKGGRLVNLDKSRYVDEDLYARWMKKPLRRSDILMTSEAPLGELFFLCRDERYCLSQRLFAIRANPRVVAPVILYLCLESEQTQHELRSRASGATVSGIRQSALRNVPIILPPRRIQDRTEPILLKLVELRTALNETVANLRRTRDLLLPWLLSGNARMVS